MDYSFQRFLLPGEKLVWTGVPKQGLVFRTADWFLIPFSLFWTAFAVFWNWTVWSTNGPLFFKLFGLPFLIAGAYFVVGRFVLDARSRAQTSYAVTDKRVLISEKNGNNLRSLDIGSLPSLELSERRNGSGTIRFGAVANPLMWGQNMWHPSLDPTPSFLGIDGVRKVYSLIQQHAAEARGKPVR